MPPPLPPQQPPPQPPSRQLGPPPPAPAAIPPAAAMPPATPGRARRGSGSWGWVVLVVLALAGGLGWWWYQQRDVTHATAPAAGDVEPTPTAAEGKLLIDARPWGRIEKVLDTASGDAVPLPAGSLFTPRAAVLPAGAYEITVNHPDAGSRTCQVEIQAGTRPTCEVLFFETDPRAYFRELGW